MGDQRKDKLEEEKEKGKQTKAAKLQGLVVKIGKDAEVMMRIRVGA